MPQDWENIDDELGKLINEVVHPKQMTLEAALLRHAKGSINELVE